MKQINKIEELIIGYLYSPDYNTNKENPLILCLHRIEEPYCLFTYEGGGPQHKQTPEHGEYVSIYNQAMFPLYEIPTDTLSETFKIKQTLFLIEKACINPIMESDTQNNYWYSPYCFVISEQEAKEFCESKGIFTLTDMFKAEQTIPKYTYKPLPLLVNK